MTQTFGCLAEPLSLGPIVARNRIWQSPLWTRCATVEGEVTDRIIAHYAARARGGAGLITQESTAVDSRHMWKEPELRIDEDRFAPGLFKLVEAVHRYNVPIIIQLHHAGMFGTDPVSPSGVPCYDMATGNYIQPRVLSIGEIEETRGFFVEAAVRAMAIGYDGVELHGSTAYLLEQFLSPHNNMRTDKYGGSLENRMLLPLEIVRSIRQKCGPDFPLGYTLVASDLLPDGVVVEDSIAFAKALEQEGITYIDLQATGTYETFHYEEAPGLTMRQKKGQFDVSAEFKKELRVPLTTRSIGEYDPAVWENAVERGMADAVRLGRPLLADPELPNKVLGGRLEEVRTCIRDQFCQESGVIRPWQLTCAVNPGLGRGEPGIQPAPVTKKVLVVGGGPGGLEAARVAALRGHKVTLMEKNATLGGNLVTASLPIAKADMSAFIPWAERECRKLGVAIELNKEVTLEKVEECKPDAVIVATGATPLFPPISGVDKPHVVTAEDVLTGKASVGKKVVVAGGGLVGFETAEYIIEKGLSKDVSIVEMLPAIAQDMMPLEMAYVFRNVIPKLGVKIFTSTKIKEITDETVVCIGANWEGLDFEADTVVLAMGYAPNDALYEELKGRIKEVFLIGDAVEARKVVNAIHDGAYFAGQL